jgi:hypothetical protein
MTTETLSTRLFESLGFEQIAPDELVWSGSRGRGG